MHFSTALLILYTEIIISRKLSSPEQKKLTVNTVKRTLLTTDLELVKVNGGVTYHPPVVDIRGQLHVVSGPNW